MMTFHDFEFDHLSKRLGLEIVAGDVCTDAPACDLPPLTAATLATFAPLVTSAFTTDKARSELLIAPLVYGVALAFPDRVRVYSGYEVVADPAAGLAGHCDFIITRDAGSFMPRSVAAVVMQAKRESLHDTLPPCVAAAVALQRDAAAHGEPSRELYGAVTTGRQWQVFRLDGKRLTVGTPIYAEPPTMVFGMLCHVTTA